MSLGYLRVESPEAKEWSTFGTEILGMAESEDPLGRPNVVALTNDDRPGRLTITEGPANRVTCIGWELRNAEDLELAAEELAAAGIDVRRGTDEERAAARVRDLVSFTDPAGFHHELFHGQLAMPGTFRPGRAMSGFVTGAQGLGHVVLVVPDLEASLSFFGRVLGFRVSDEIDTMFGRAVFMHVNPRHHTLALLGMPGLRGLHHLMVQVESLDDVGVAYDMVTDREIPLAMTLGRHTNDRMVSFYVRSPSGFEIEYGWGAATIANDDEWTATHMVSMSIWGHRPGTAGPPGCLEPVGP
jgi:extradiol dioxygenase